MTDISKLNKSILDGLSEQEKKLLIKTLEEISKGNSKALDDIKYADYEEIPVDIETFLHDKRYLGNGLIDPEGRFTVFPYWENTLKKIFPNNLTTSYNTIILTGCLSYDTEVLLIDGRHMKIGELAEIAKCCQIDEYVYSFDVESSTTKKGHLINAFSTGIKKVYRINLSDGSSIKATSNHKFFTKYGDWCSIDLGLKLGTELLLLTKDLIYKTCSVKSIEYVGEEEVFDLTVENYHNFVLENGVIAHNSIGIGKSFFAVLCIAYLLHRMLCLKDPYTYYGLQPIDKISFSLINVTIEAAKGVAWDKLQQLLQTSPWFMEHGTTKGRSDISWSPNKRIELIVGSNNNAVIGRALFANFTDEVNFSSMTSDVDKIKNKQKHLISQIDARMQSRFMKGTYLPTLNIIASSKTSDQSFLDGYIETKRKNNSNTTLIVDEPQWVVRNDKDSPVKFYVAVGNKFLASEVLPKDAPQSVIEEYRAKGYQMLEVPIGYYEAFCDNVELALTDIAGVSSTSALKYISGVRLNEIKINSYKNPMSKEIIEVGTGDKIQYSQFFDINLVPSALKAKPMYVHLDMSKSGDRTGIAGVWIMGKRQGTSENKGDKESYYRVAFSFAVKAPKGYEISFEKNRNFIRWLRSKGFNIKGVSMDTFQSAQIQQQLASDGFDVKTISVDRLENIQGTNTKVCIPYAFFKTAIYEKRLELFWKCDLLTNEIVGLEKESDGHINHPEGGTQGSKDESDAVCGALFNASQNIEQFSYDYGESMDDIIVTNKVSSSSDMKHQINIKFEEELQNLLMPESIKKAKQEELKKDNNSPYGNRPIVTNGMLIW